MFTNYLKIAVRNLLRHKLYSAINIFGLSLGVGCCIIVLLFIRYEWSYDSFYKNGDSLYQLLVKTKQPNGEWAISGVAPPSFAAGLKAEFPEIRYAARFVGRGALIRKGDEILQDAITFTEPEIFSTFDIEFLKGNPSTALRNPNEAVVTEEMAKKYFGDDDPMGKTLTMQNWRFTPWDDFTVVGVVKTMPENSTYRWNFFLNFPRSMTSDADNPFNWTVTFFQLQRGASPREIEQKAGVFLQKYAVDLRDFRQGLKGRGVMSTWGTEMEDTRLEFESIKDVHFDTREWIGNVPRSTLTRAAILAGIALLVLAIASINFVTLAIGRFANRAKEVGIRKVLGARRSQVMRQFWGEAFILCCFALLLGLVLAELVLPVFNQFLDSHLSFSSLSDPWLLVELLALLLVVGTVAGGYPSLHLSKPQPTATLKGIAKIGGNNALTRTLVVFQFGLSIFLITGALGMATQLRFMMTKDIGLNLKNVIALAGISTQSSFPDYRADRNLVERLRTRLKSNPNIVACSWAAGSPGWSFFRSFQYHGETKKVIMLRADEEYLGIFGLQLIEGRNFIAGSADDRENGMIVNETFAREMGWSSPVVGNYLTDVDDTTLAGLRIIGVVKDAHFSSLHNSIQPLIISQRESWRANALLLRVVPTRIAEIMAYLKNVWKEIVPDKPFSGYFADELFQDQYADDEKWTTIIEYATVLAVVLACLGLFGLATLSAANRTKEIGIRKVLGASVSGIVELLARDFVKLVLVANVIAWPIAYFALNRWLQNFAYRIDLSWWLFLLSGGLAVLIALLTVSTQAIRAALANPVDSLRYE